MKNVWMYICREGNTLWIDGVKKRKFPEWAGDVPDLFEGFADKCEDAIDLYSDDWQKVKTIELPLDKHKSSMIR